MDEYGYSDNDFWRDLKWPAAPNEDDVRVFQSYCTGRVLLLGSTRLLLPLCDEAWDIEPKYSDPKIKKRDWFGLNSHWDTIIVDGVLVYGKEYTERLLPVLLAHTDRLVVRSFLNPTWKTKYATWFPRIGDFNPAPKEHPIDEVYTFFIWNNLQS